MKKDIIKNLMELYEIMIDNGVVLQYCSETIALGEITNIEFSEDGFINIEINNIENHNIEIDEFIENHIKNGVNYHTWETVRMFDRMIEKF